jgi:hypothetical protein
LIVPDWALQVWSCRSDYKFKHTYNFKISNNFQSFTFRWFKNSTLWWKVKDISKKQILTGSLENMFWWKPLSWFSHWRLPSSWVKFLTVFLLTYCEKKSSSVWEKLLKLRAEGREFSTIYSNSERSKQFVVTECFFNLFLKVSQIQ